jgi:hypothetical protein
MIVVIPTCPSYADIARPFVHFLNRNWPHCPYRRVFINGPDHYPGYDNYRTATDRGWTANLLEFLEKEDVRENICLLMDDYMLVEPVSPAVVSQADASISSKVGYIRLIPYSDNDFNSGQGWMWPSHVPYDDHYNIADIDRHSPKKLTRLPISLQPAIWNSTFIRTYFNPDWSPWQQEVLASRELCKSGTILGKSCDYVLLTTKTFAFTYVNAIRDGKYSPEFVALINATAELHPFAFTRDVAIPHKLLNPDQKRALLARQTDGTYPHERYG